MESHSKAPSRVTAVIALAVAVRLALCSYTPVLQGRMELSTPVSSYERLVEGSTLLNYGVNPYSGNLVHHSPILVHAHNTMAPYMSDLLWSLAFIAMDVVIALNLVSIVRPYRVLLRRVDHANDDDALISTLVCIAYLMNPHTVLSMLSRSTVIVSNLAISFALRGAMNGNVLLASLGMAIAAYETMYPLVLLPLMMVLVHTFHKKSAALLGALVMLCVGGLLGTSAWLVGDWSFVEATYGALILVPELKPNVGLFWYFFLEVFDHYRGFFLVVFHMALLSFTIPIVCHFRHRPLVGLFLLLCGIRIFKSYPAVGDNALHLALLPLFSHFVKESKHIYVFFIVLIVCSVLGPVFIYLWLYPGSANANFPYALGLLLTYAHGSILAEVLKLSKFEDYYIVFGRTTINGHTLTLVRSGTKRTDPPQCTSSESEPSKKDDRDDGDSGGDDDEVEG